MSLSVVAMAEQLPPQDANVEEASCRARPSKGAHVMGATPAWPPWSLPRLFVEMPLAAGASLILDGAPANYLGNVLRLGVGTRVKLFDDLSGEWLAEITEAGKKRVTLTIV